MTHCNRTHAAPMVAAIVFVLLAGLACAMPHAPTIPPHQTAAQKATMQGILAYAGRQSRAAMRELEAVFELPATVAALNKRCPALARAPAADLARRLVEEMRTAEITHTFPAAKMKDRPWLEDVTLDTATELPYFPNMWELSTMGKLNVSAYQWKIQDAAETGIYRLPAFPESTLPPASFVEAEDRPIYGSLNYQRVDTGVWSYGAISMVFQRDALSDMLAWAPVDSGIYALYCNKSLPWKPQKILRWLTPIDCSAWPSANVSYQPSQDDHKPLALGNVADMAHLILPNFRFYVKNIPDAVAGLLCHETPSWRHTLEYMESNILGTIKYLNGGVKMIVASFADLFGTQDGRKLQAWCTAHGWPLAWGIGDAGQKASKFVTWDTRPWPGRTYRLLDPEVTQHAALNVSMAQNSTLEFEMTWRDVNATRAQGKSLSPADWNRWWDMLANRLNVNARLRPLRAYQCADTETCIGTVDGGACVCKRH